MSQQTVTTGKNLYEAFVRGDIPAVLGEFDQQIIWVEPDGGLIPGTFQGPQAIVEKFFMRIPEVYGHLEILARDFIDGGDRLVVLGDYRLNKSGTSATVPFAHVWEVKNGKFTRYQDFTDTTAIDQALA
jgi:hypothetical protein